MQLTLIQEPHFLLLGDQRDVPEDHDRQFPLCFSAEWDLAMAST